MTGRLRMKGVAGASLVELMISIAVGLIIMAAVLMVLANSSRTRAEIQRTSEKLENGRYAIELLTEELQHAGFYGEMKPTVAPALPLPDPCSQDRAVWEAGIAFHVQGYTEASGVPSCIASARKAGTDVLVVRRAKTCAVGAAGCDALVAGEPYLQISFCKEESTTYAVGTAGDALLELKAKDCTSAAPLRRFVVHTYFISPDNGAGRQVPTLKRAEFAGAEIVTTPLVEGVERMRFEYGIDTDNDGAPDAYTSDPDSFAPAGCTSCTAERNWSNVMAVRMYLLVRASDSAPGHVDTKVYELGKTAAGETVSAGPFNDAYQRRVYTGAVRLVNASARRETP